MQKNTKFKKYGTHLGAAVALAISGNLAAQTPSTEEILRQLEALKGKVTELETQLKAAQQREQARDAEVEERVAQQVEEVYAAKESSREGINVHGAVRFQYTNERYNEGNKDRGGDFDFDTFRINLDGSIGDVILSGEYRFYQYMHTLHHAWVGYDFSDALQVQAGINQVPFGITPYNSHNFFFSSNYYVGLEDDYDAGIKLIYDEKPWNLQLAFYKNDEQGGVDGYVSDRSERYSYDVVGYRDGEGIWDAPAHAVAENNTFNGRAAYTLSYGDGWSTELGASVQFGDLHDGNGSVGDHGAYAIHLLGNYGPWNLQLQATDYEYDLDSGADLMAVGAYAFYDTIPAEARTYTAGLSYSMPVKIGPITNLTFYNDYSLITDKSADLDDTWMNVTGVAISAGGVYAYLDYVLAKNQPFIGGTMAGDADDSESRINLNIGYYF